MTYNFEKGNIVSITNTEIIGVVLAAEEENVLVKLCFDGAKLFAEEKREMYNVQQLETVQPDKNDIRGGWLEYISQQAAVGNASDSKGRSEQRIPFVLKQLEEVWSSFPDMRLGQLLCACGGKDPFYTEDSTMVQQLVKFGKEHKIQK